MKNRFNLGVGILNAATALALAMIDGPHGGAFLANLGFAIFNFGIYYARNQIP